MCCREENPCHTLLPSCNKLLTCWGKRQMLLLRWPKSGEETVFPPWSQVWCSKFPKPCHPSSSATTLNYTLHCYIFQIIPTASCSTKIQTLKSYGISPFLVIVITGRWVVPRHLSCGSELCLGLERTVLTLTLASRRPGTTENQPAKTNLLCKRSAGHCLLLPEPKHLPEKAKSCWQVVATRKCQWRCSIDEIPASARECPTTLGLLERTLKARGAAAAS